MRLPPLPLAVPLVTLLALLPSLAACQKSPPDAATATPAGAADSSQGKATLENDIATIALPVESNSGGPVRGDDERKQLLRAIERANPKAYADTAAERSALTFKDNRH